MSDARQLKVLEIENAQAQELVAEQLLAIDTLKEFSRGKWHPDRSARQIRLTKDRGLSARAACRLLGFSRRVTG